MSLVFLFLLYPPWINAWHQVMRIFFSLELFIILNLGGMWTVGRPEGVL